MGDCGDLSYQGDAANRLWKSLRWPFGWWVLDMASPERTATGTIAGCHIAPDGDVHIDLDVSLSPGSQELLNNANPPNTLICEIPLGDRPNFMTVLEQLAIGQVVQISGRWCTDIGHGWNELHPTYQITTPKTTAKEKEKDKEKDQLDKLTQIENIAAPGMGGAEPPDAAPVRDTASPMTGGLGDPDSKHRAPGRPFIRPEERPWVGRRFA